MKLGNIMKGVETAVEYTRDIDIRGLAIDSRRVESDYLFAALDGKKTSGYKFIPEAIRRGASAILTAIGNEKDETVITNDNNNVEIIPVANPHRSLAIMAANFFEHQPEHIAAVTGTNGKTSVVDFTRQIWEYLGNQSASIGTLGTIAKGFPRKPSLTTPDPISLHRDLAELAQNGTTHLALEASSHGLDQFRLDGVKVSIAGFTNLSRDHLDYHGDMKTYKKAKTRLFSEILEEGGTAVINADIPEFRELALICLNSGRRMFSYGYDGVDLTVINNQPMAHGQKLTLSIFGKRHEIILPIAAEFQVQNALCALGMVIASGCDADKATKALETLTAPKGRIDLIASCNGASAYIDYAHTPDALKKAIASLKPHCAGKFYVVFGCGGDRDAGKRPEMGAIASEMADVVIVTDDNPRSEDPAKIRSQIIEACPKAIEIANRKTAIFTAVGELQEGDILLVAGKGHETGQIIKGQILPFDDSKVLLQAMTGEGNIQEKFQEETEVLWNSEEIATSVAGIASGKWDAYGLAIRHDEVKAGDLFVALATQDYNGHEFVKEALENGAVAAVVHSVPDNIEREKLVIVANTENALEDLANASRLRSTAKIALVIENNENGEITKTLKTALNKTAPVHSIENVFDTKINTAYALASMPVKCSYLILNVMMNQSGIIKDVSGMARPNVVVFPYSENSMQNKSRVLEAITGVDTNGLIVLSRDDQAFEEYGLSARNYGIRRMVSYGFSGSSYVHIRAEKNNKVLRYENQDFIINSRVSPETLATTVAASLALGANAKEIAQIICN
ncbi:MAG: UDP-N-acetylmuramoyl-L-alanyl-D-glutamate--2,6-diaminopimelate ligase [Alphaproteobacteria bacterium]